MPETYDHVYKHARKSLVDILTYVTVIDEVYAIQTFQDIHSSNNIVCNVESGSDKCLVKLCCLYARRRREGRRELGERKKHA